MKRVLALSIPMALAATATALTCHWTGAGGDGLWTNALNWAEGAVPGRYVGSAQAQGEDADEALFGAVADGVATTIDLSGHICISNLFILADAPAYTFGTSSSQTLSIPSLGTLEVCEGNVFNQTFACKTTLGYFDSSLGTQRSKGLISYYRNNGTGLLDFQGGWIGTYNHYPTLCGTGDIRTTDTGLTHIPKNKLQGILWITGEQGKTAAYVKAGGLESQSEGTALRRIMLPNSTSRLNVNDWGSPVTFTIGVDTIIGGEGIFAIHDSRPASSGIQGTGVCFRANASAATLVVSNRIEASSAVGLKYFKVSGSGRISLLNTLSGEHSLFRIDDTVAVSIPKIGNLGCELADTSVGPSVEMIAFGSSGTLNYIGTGETTDRAIHADAAKVITVVNSGSGALTLAGEVSAAVSGATLRLDAETAPIVLSGTLSDEHSMNLAIAGSEVVTLAHDYGFGALSMTGGILAFDTDVAAPTLPSVSIASGQPVICVGAGKTLTVASIAVTSGWLDFEVPAGAEVVVSSLSIPSNVRVNGNPAGITAEGRLYAKLTEWAAAVDGTWSEGAKWSAGVPLDGWGANIAAAGDSYTVTMTSTPTAYPDILSISNVAAGATATLRALEPIGVTNKHVIVAAGGVLQADAGLVVTNTVVGKGSFIVASGGVVRVTGGEFQAPPAMNPDTAAVDLVFRGGLVEMSGDSSFVISDPCLIGSGELRFLGLSKIVRRSAGGRIHVRPNAAGETATLSFMAANATHNFRTGVLRLGGTPGGCAVFNLAAQNSDTIMYVDGTQANGVWIGYEAGIGILNISGGRFSSGNPGLHLGAYYTSASPTPVGITGDNGMICAPTGIIEVTGGDLRPSGWSTGSYYPDGLIIGDGTYSKAGAPRARGFMFLREGGTVTPNQNATYIGVGNGEGDLIQTGGSFTHSSLYQASTTIRYGREAGDADALTFSYQFVIGLDGGIGRYVISNGTCTVNANNKVFVGGTDVDTLSWGSSNPWTKYGYAADATGAYGLFAVRGGTVTLGNSMYLGCDGTGELEIGTNGTLSIARDLVLSNNTASVLRIVMGETATAPDVSIGGKLVLTDGAHLVLDLSALRSGRIWIPLILPTGGVEGVLSEEQVTIIPPTNPVSRTGRREVLTSREGVSGLWLYQPAGTLMTFR